MSKSNFEVVIHYEGACVYSVEAETEDAAKEIARQKFDNESPANILRKIQWDVVDCTENK